MMGAVRVVAALLWGAVAACADGAAPTQPVALFAQGGVSGRYIVTTKGEPRGVAAVHGLSPSHVYTKVLNGFAAQIPEQALEGLRRNPNVELVEPDGIATTQAVGSWGLDRIDARVGLDGFYTPPGTGSGVVVYVIDTGILPSHSDFGGRALVGFDAYGSNGIDCNGHGTHVAGTVGGTTYGVAKGVTLKGVRVLDCSGSGSYSAVIAGLDWVATACHGKCVANMSLGGSKSEALNTATRNLVASGVVTVVAAGNNQDDALRYSPSSTLEAVTVAAADQSDTRAWFSNWGTAIDLFAPGVGILSAWSDGGTRTISGTSMAAPHVAGVAALLLEQGAAAADVPALLVSYATKGVVKDPASPAWHMLYAFPVVDASNPVWPVPAPPAAPSDFTVTITGTDATAASLRFEWRDNSDNEDQFRLYAQNIPLWGSQWVLVGGAAPNTTAINGIFAHGQWSVRITALVFGGPEASSPIVDFCTGPTCTEPPPPEEPPPPDDPPPPPPPEDCPSGKRNPQGKCVGKR